jgi:hypothetical protein
MYKSNLLTLQERIGNYGYKAKTKKTKREKNLEKARELPEISNSEALAIIAAMVEVNKKDIA